MPSGVGVEIIIVVALLVVLAAAFVAGLRLRGRPEVPAPAAAPPTGLSARVREVFAGGRATDAEWERLERALIQADAGAKASRDVVRRVRDRYRPGADPAELLAAEIAGTFQADPGLELPERAVVMV